MCMSEMKHFIVHGIVKLPIQLNVFTKNEVDAIQYANSVLNTKNFSFFDADLYTTNGKIHYLKCDKLIIDWHEATEL